jgi:hypothetical protein
MRSRTFLFVLVLALTACGGGPGPTPPPGMHSVSLSWTEAQTVTGFNVYRDGAQIGSPTQETYTDQQVASGQHAYYVTAFNADGESNPSDTVTVTIP